MTDFEIDPERIIAEEQQLDDEVTRQFIEVEELVIPPVLERFKQQAVELGIDVPSGVALDELSVRSLSEYLTAPDDGDRAVEEMVFMALVYKVVHTAVIPEGPEDIEAVMPVAYDLANYSKFSDEEKLKWLKIVEKLSGLDILSYARGDQTLEAGRLEQLRIKGQEVYKKRALINATKVSLRAIFTEFITAEYGVRDNLKDIVDCVLSCGSELAREKGITDLLRSRALHLSSDYIDEAQIDRLIGMATKALERVRDQS